MRVVSDKNEIVYSRAFRGGGGFIMVSQRDISISRAIIAGNTE